MARHTRVPMSSLTALTLHKNKKTTYRRTSAVPQLTCQGKGCRVYTPDVVQCTVMGTSYSGMPEWECRADLPEGLRMGSVELGCEGFDSSSDPFILAGSCGLTYNLVQTSAFDRSPYPTRITSSHSPIDTLANLLTYSLVAWALYTICKSVFPNIARWWRGTGPASGRTTANSRGSGGGGGGGGPAPGFGGGPPPPYTKATPPRPTQRTEAAPGGETGGWRPGFWSGAAAAYAGAQAVNWLTDNRGGGMARDREYEWEQRRARTAQYGMRDRGGLFGGGGGGDWDRGVGGSGTRWGGGGDGGSSLGEGLRPSTGFGSTRNR